MDAGIVTAIVGGLATLAGTALGSRLSRLSSVSTARELVSVEREKFVSGKMWEARHAIYNQIIFQVRKAGTFAHIVDSGFHDGPGHAEDYYRSKSFADDANTCSNSWQPPVA